MGEITPKNEGTVGFDGISGVVTPTYNWLSGASSNHFLGAKALRCDGRNRANTSRRRNDLPFGIVKVVGWGRAVGWLRR